MTPCGGVKSTNMSGNVQTIRYRFDLLSRNLADSSAQILVRFTSEVIMAANHNDLGEWKYEPKHEVLSPYVFSLGHFARDSDSIRLMRRRLTPCVKSQRGQPDTFGFCMFRRTYRSQSCFYESSLNRLSLLRTEYFHFT